MNVFSKITLKSLLKNRTRTIVTIVGVILSASMLTAVTTFISSLQNQLMRTAIMQDGDWHIRYDNIYDGFLEKLENDEEVERFAVSMETDYVFSRSLMTESENSVSFRVVDGHDSRDLRCQVFAYDDVALSTLPINLTAGRLPENEDEIVLTYANNFFKDYKIGDTLTTEKRVITTDWSTFQDGDEVTFETVTKSYEIVGLSGFLSYTNQLHFITKIGDEDVHESARYSVYVKLKNPRSVYVFNSGNAANYINETVDEFNKVNVSSAYNKNYLRTLGISDNNNINQVLYSLAAILISLIMIGSILLINNSFYISVAERTKQFGILSSVGATRKQLRKSVLFEGFFIGIIGIPLGVIAGIAGIGVTLNVVTNLLADSLWGAPLTLHISWESVAVAVVIGAITILISAYIPAVKAARVSAIESIRQSRDIKLKPGKLKTSKLTQKLFGIEGILASKNFKRDKKRYRATIISLFVSVVLFVSANSFAETLKRGVNMAVDVVGYDISFTSDDMETDDFLMLFDEINSTENVTDGGYYFTYTYRTQITSEMMSDAEKQLYGYADADRFIMDHIVFLNFIDDENYSKYLDELNLHDGSDSMSFPCYTISHTYNTTERRVIRENMVGDLKNLTLELTPNMLRGGENVTLSLNFVEVMPAIFMQMFSGNFLVVYAPFSALEKFNLDEISPENPMMTFLSDKPNTTFEEIENLAENYTHVYQLYNIAEAQRQERNVLLVINIFSYGFIILMSLITVANVFNTISTNVNLRRREFAVLKSVGLSDRSFNKMMCLECVTYGAKALFYGLPVSLFVSYLIYKSVNFGVEINYLPPLGGIIVSAGVVFLVVFATMVYSLAKVRGENTVDTLRNEVI
ncbi:MAG: ABC transporter permease [Oscillospiraceae bacterium]|nr:ABC transporter permease [Oscillospiraceae bacterium]